MNKLVLLEELQEYAVDELDKLERYKEEVERAKAENEAKGGSRWDYWDYVNWDARIPSKNHLINTLRMIRKLTLDIEKEIL